MPGGLPGGGIGGFGIDRYIKLKDSLTTFIEIQSYPGAVPDRKLLQISVTSCSDAK